MLPRPSTERHSEPNAQCREAAQNPRQRIEAFLRSPRRDAGQGERRPFAPGRAVVSGALGLREVGRRTGAAQERQPRAAKMLLLPVACLSADRVRYKKERFGATLPAASFLSPRSH